MYKTNILKKYKLPSLKLVIFGGSKINSKVLDEFKNSLPHTIVLQAYGDLIILYYIFKIKSHINN